MQLCWKCCKQLMGGKLLERREVTEGSAGVPACRGCQAVLVARFRVSFTCQLEFLFFEYGYTGKSCALAELVCILTESLAGLFSSAVPPSTPFFCFQDNT